MHSFHATGILLALHIPLAFCGLLPEVIQSSADDALAFLLSFHGLLGLNIVITDYVPKRFTFGVRAVALLSMTMAGVGLYKLGRDGGPGLSQTVKGLWIQPKKE